MTRHENRGSRWFLRTAVVLGIAGLALAASLSGASEPSIVALPSGARQTLVPPPAGIQAFHPGEALTYEVSWSGMFSAGTVTMTVETERLPDGREVLGFVVQGRTHGLMDTFYPVNDEVRSVFDPLLMQSLSYRLRESYGSKKRLRVTEFDHAKRTAVCRLNVDPAETLATPDPVQDGLSLLYLLRTREDLATGRRMDIDVVDSGRTWTVQVSVLAREKVRTAAGEFDTIKTGITIHPRDAEGAPKRREAVLWLTDDGRKVPVLMKSTLRVGSFVFELVGLRPGTHAIRQ